jgi:hypothetical protein
MASCVPGELIPCAFVWHDPGITPCCKSLFAVLIKNSPRYRRDFRVKMSSSIRYFAGQNPQAAEALAALSAGRFRSPDPFLTVKRVVIRRIAADSLSGSALPRRCSSARSIWR